LGLSREFWAGRRVLLTGHTGFKGSWLSLWLQGLGAEVTGYASGTPTARSLFETARVGEGMESVAGDIRDAEALAGAATGSGAEVVIHMAAQSLVGRSYADPVGTYEANVLGTVNALEAARHSEAARVVLVVTSDKCYENRGLDRGYREDDPLGGGDPYSSSKAAAELVTAAYRSSFFGDAGGGAAVATARAGNVIGGGDWTEGRLVPDLVAAALDGDAVEIRSPDAVRPWQHVLNPLSGYLLLCERLAESDEYAEPWNFGPAAGDERPVREVIERLGAAWGKPVEWRHESAPETPEAHELRVDSTKARERLGWAPHWNLDAALEQIVAWYRAHDAGEDLRAHSLAEIEAFSRGG
jgi:CDP-glucose 4,6-dehydratase